MLICANSFSGLALLRRARASGALSYAQVCGLPEPDPSPQRHWSRRLVPHQLLGLEDPPDARHPIHVAVPSQELRPRAAFFATTIYSSGLPAGSFLQIGEGLVIPCPELLFVELALVMHPAAQALLGYELCGSYVRDALHPRCGHIAHGCGPVTSVDAIRRFIGRCGRVKGKRPALAALGRVRDNAWSSMESVCALLMSLPVSESGYGLEGVRLNVRHSNPCDLVGRGCKASRVPDIVLDDLPIGFNYDGYDHLDLQSVLDAAGDEAALRQRLGEIRGKYVDDRRRDRELAAQGRVVMPIVAEDLSAPGGLDTIIIEALMASERLGGPSRPDAISDDAWSPSNVHARQRLLWSLLPWRDGKSLGAY